VINTLVVTVILERGAQKKRDYKEHGFKALMEGQVLTRGDHYKSDMHGVSSNKRGRYKRARGVAYICY